LGATRENPVIELTKVWPNGIEPGRGGGHTGEYNGLPLEATELVWLTGNGNSTLDCGCHSVRLELVIPSTDRRLRSYRKLGGYHRDALDLMTEEGQVELARRFVREWWAYRGAIPLDRITGLEIVCGHPYWLEL